MKRLSSPAESIRCPHPPPANPPSLLFWAPPSPDVCPIPIPLLRQGAGAAAVSLTSQQAACLLAHAFFCNFPDGGRLRPYLNRFNFKDLFATAQQAQLAKLRCVLQYFEVVVNEAEPRVRVPLHPVSGLRPRP